jgi:SAM-dependent methyltransferase
VVSENERNYRNRARAESFGRVAETYDRARPSYPGALIDDLVALGPHDVLDVGTGTGRAAELLMARGLSVLGVEVDAQMAAVARSHGVATEVGGFETWPAAGREFDLIVSGQAWHWIDPAVGAEKAFHLLRPKGSLALFWNIGDFDDQARPTFDRVYSEVAPSVLGSTVRGSHREIDGYVPSLRAAGFASWRQRSYPWQQTYRRDDWLAMVSTHSDHSTLPAETRIRLLARLGAAIDGLGGSVVMRYTTELLLATR